MVVKSKSNRDSDDLLELMSYVSENDKVSPYKLPDDNRITIDSLKKCLYGLL